MIVNMSNLNNKFDIKIDRSTKWGNPYSHKTGTKASFKVNSLEESLRCYEIWLDGKILSGQLNIEELRGKVLGCWCKPKKCHGDIILKKLYPDFVDIFKIKL